MIESAQVTVTGSVAGKFQVAREMERYDTIGEDLVSRVVDGLVINGSQPISFNTYIHNSAATGEVITSMKIGLTRGCLKAGVELIINSGDNSVLQGNENDLAGTALGAKDSNLQLDSTQTKSGDLLIAMPASGMHANGFALVNQILETHQLAITRNYEFAQTLGEVLLTPSEIYTLDCLALIRAQASNIRAFSHIAEGGIAENTARVMPVGLTAIYDRSTWSLPQEMKFLAAAGGISQRDMERTWNCGIGMSVIVDPAIGELMIASLAARGMKAWVAGHVAVSPDVDTPRSSLVSQYQ
jgi:phosphoribosylformylglycinamidine cyclo-ligase